MAEDLALSRRALLATPAIAAFAATSACAQGKEATGARGTTTLVAYLTRSGNTRVIAETLQRQLGAALFEIRPATPYPADYEQHVAQATRERNSGYQSPLAAQVEGLARYDQIFLGFPIWGGTVPPPIRSFLGSHDLRGRTVRPFITHGGYGIGDSQAVLARGAPGARLQPAFQMEADQERRTLNTVREWLGGTGLR